MDAIAAVIVTLIMAIGILVLLPTVIVGMLSAGIVIAIAVGLFKVAALIFD